MSTSTADRLRSLERAVEADPTNRELTARLIEERIRAGGRDPRRDPRAGDMLAIPSPRGWTYTDGSPMWVMREVVRTIAPLLSDKRSTPLVEWRWIDHPGGLRALRGLAGMPKRCSLSAWRRWARTARIVDPMKEDRDGRRPGEDGMRASQVPCDRVRPDRYHPGYCWCGWLDTTHAGGA